MRRLLLIFPLILATCAMQASESPKTESIVLGGGCFWCVQAAYQLIPGVVSTTCGYAGGHTSDPTYEDVCTGDTGHAEVVKVVFDPKVISLDQIFAYFWKIHDPTSLNRQGADVGTQYRSTILYSDEAQKQAAERAIAEVQPYYSRKIVTVVAPLEHFWRAEDYHQNYFEKHPDRDYCAYVIAPKIHKLEKELASEKKK